MLGKDRGINQCRIPVAAALRDAERPAAERLAYNQIATPISPQSITLFAWHDPTEPF
jgi:hypothetical protein